jgi:hypothetical protein
VDPTNVATRLDLGRALFEAGRLEGAVEMIDSCLDGTARVRACAVGGARIVLTPPQRPVAPSQRTTCS